MDREHTPTEENLAKEIMKKLDVCKMRLAFMSECLAELCESETISRNGGRVIDRRRTVGQDANLERVLQEVRCSSTRDYRENPSGDSPIKTNRSSQLGVVDCTSQGCPSLCNSRHYIKRRNLREPTPTEWRSLYKDRLKRLFNDAENYSWDEELDGGSAVLYREVEFYPGGMRILDSSHGTSSRVAYESLPPTEWQSTESCHLYRAGHPLVLVIVFGRPIRRGRRRSFDVYFKCLEADHVAQKCPEKDGCGEPHHTQAKESIEFASARTNSDPATKLTNVSSPDTMETMNATATNCCSALLYITLLFIHCHSLFFPSLCSSFPLLTTESSFSWCLSRPNLSTAYRCHITHYLFQLPIYSKYSPPLPASIQPFVIPAIFSIS
ncbi:hypothetical protein T4A_2383 [Trichinella pseudospiralis]|uniref:Uncharacterized protein n=1 Tax=Trichinella pseudospiralis TaxID=6337 RepID=A0A0V1ET83_TRIPS|nr:hypothetical protein T4A_2383 [Trichinella pseudospiralis]KRZ45480.1 hypothetical protein T4C_4238 [Trichinella pseudospiralis]